MNEFAENALSIYFKCALYLFYCAVKLGDKEQLDKEWLDKECLDKERLDKEQLGVKELFTDF